MRAYSDDVAQAFRLDVAAVDMDQEDGLIWVYGPGNDGVMAFTDFGIETLRKLVETLS